MPDYFLDSSALVKRYRREIGTDRVLQITDGTDRLVIARLAHVEVASAIIRRGRAVDIHPEELTGVLAVLDREIRQSFQVIDLDGPVLSRAVDLVRTHALRGGDAVQLACALLARADIRLSQEFFLVSSDHELNTAAIAEGLQIIDPAAG